MQILVLWKSLILTTSIQNWRSTRWLPLTNTTQHLHCRHTTTKSTGSDHDLQDGITITFTSTNTAKKYIQPCLHTIVCLDKTKQSHTKSRRTLFTQDPAEYKSNLDLKINNTAQSMTTHPKVMDLILYPKIT